MKLRKPKKNASWHVTRIDSTPGLYRLIAPLAVQKGKQKTICVAIGSKRLKHIIDYLNDIGVEV